MVLRIARTSTEVHLRVLGKREARGCEVLSRRCQTRLRGNLWREVCGIAGGEVDGGDVGDVEGGAGCGVGVLCVADVAVGNALVGGAVRWMGGVESGITEGVYGGAGVLRFAEFEEGGATDWISIRGDYSALTDTLSAVDLTYSSGMFENWRS
jgi:hypothetical protein